MAYCNRGYFFFFFFFLALSNGNATKLMFFLRVFKMGRENYIDIFDILQLINIYIYIYIFTIPVPLNDDECILKWSPDVPSFVPWACLLDMIWMDHVSMFMKFQQLKKFWETYSNLFISCFLESLRFVSCLKDIQNKIK